MCPRAVLGGVRRLAPSLTPVLNMAEAAVTLVGGRVVDARTLEPTNDDGVRADGDGRLTLPAPPDAGLTRVAAATGRFGRLSAKVNHDASRSGPAFGTEAAAVGGDHRLASLAVALAAALAPWRRRRSR